jgi:hypothetical protein
MDKTELCSKYCVDYIMNYHDAHTGDNYNKFTVKKE